MVFRLIYFQISRKFWSETVGRVDEEEEQTPACT